MGYLLKSVCYSPFSVEQILWAVTDWVASTSASEDMGETDSFIWLFVACHKAC